jgi:hypothetical protein
MNKSSLPTWLSGLCVLLLAAVLALQLKESARLKALERQQAVLATVVNQQTAVLHRALGKVIPVELPESLMKKLGALEARVTDERAWPKGEADADAMLAELRDLVRQIPPWAEEDLLPRLNALRWDASGIALLTNGQTVTNGELADFLDALDTAVEAKPDGASKLVLIQLTAIQAKLKTKLDAFRRDKALADAERLLKDGGASAEFPEIAERLSEWAGVPGLKERIENLQHGLRVRVLADDTARFTASVDAGLLRLRGETSPMVRQLSLGRLLDSVMSQRQILLENPDASAAISQKLAVQSAQIEKAIEAEGKAQVAEQEKKLRGYQSWALTQIRKFNDEMNAAEGFRVPFGLVHDGNDYAGIKNAMTNYILPITVGLLDPAVSRLYNEAFERGWKKLENKKQIQTEVAEQEAIVEKLKP